MTLTAPGAGAVDIVGDTQLWGVHENETYAVWGNLTVPAGTTLTLRNVTVVFRTDREETYGIRVGEGASLLIQDGDDDPSTRGDASKINASGGPWFLAILDGDRFVMLGSRLAKVGKDHYEPATGYIQGLWVTCDSVDIRGSSIQGIGRSGTVRSSSVTVEGTDISNLYLTVDLLGDLASMDDCSLETTTMIVVNGRSLEVERTALKDTTLVSYSFDRIRVTETRFEGSDLVTHTASQVDVVGCHIRGTGSQGLYLAGNTVRVTDCRFEDASQGLYVHDTMQTIVLGCAFDNVTYPIRQSFPFNPSEGDLDVRNVSIEGARTGVILRTGKGAVSFSDTVWNGSMVGIEIIEWDGPVDLVNCTFSNMSHAGITVMEGSELGLRSCSFVDVTMGVSGDPGAPEVWELEVTDSSFNGFSFGLDLIGANVTAIGNAFGAGHIPDGVSNCIRIRSTIERVVHSMVLSDNVFADATTGVHIKPYLITNTTATITGNRFTGCAQGLVAYNLTLATLEGNVFEGCREAVRLEEMGQLTVDDLTISNGTDGISILSTVQIRLGHLDLRHLTGTALLESFVGDSLWTVDGQQVIDGGRAIITGEVRVSGTLRLVDAEMNITAKGTGFDGITVSKGGSLVLEGSSLQGRANWPFFLTVTDGGTLTVVDSTIAHCGGSHMESRYTGPYLEGDGHRLEGLRSLDCHKGLVLVRARVELVDCQVLGENTGIACVDSTLDIAGSEVSGPLMGISARGSNLTLNRCSVNSTTIGLKVEWCVLSILSSTLRSSLTTVWAESTTLEVVASTVGTEGELVHLYGTALTMHTCEVAPLRANGGQLEASLVRLYDTRHEGSWVLVGTVAMVEQFWYHRATVVTRWDGSRVVGTWIDVMEPDLDGEYLVRTLTDANGTSEPLWLLQREVTNTGEVVRGPYTFVVDGDGIHGEAVSPGDARWEGSIELSDLRPPDLTLSWPLNGSLHNVTDIMMAGTVRDVGSGLEGLYASIDGGRWYMISSEEGPWKAETQLLDGTHSIMMRANDLDGGETVVGIDLIVDTVPPLVVFTSPSEGTTSRSSRVQVLGFVVGDEGTPISDIRFNDEAIELNGTGHFSLEVQMGVEGPNPFTMVAVDRAGNRVEALLVIFLDRTPPLLLLDELPGYTREQELVVRGSVSDPLEVSVTIDGGLVAKLTNGTFETTLILSLGRNDITIEAVDAVGNMRSVRRSVVFDTRVNGTVVHPLNGAVVNTRNVMLLIEADPRAWVRVRDLTEWTLAPVNGTFGIWVTLEEGENQLLVDFRDEANNTHVVVLDVVLRPGKEDGTEGLPTILWMGLSAFAVLAIILLLHRRGVLGIRD